jgi:glycosyltransferase involved in cell wall biosynthesis
MKILCIFTTYPIPTDSGDKRRNLAVISELSRRHNLTVASIIDNSEQLRALTNKYPWTFHYAKHNSRKILPALKALCTFRTYREAKYYNKELQCIINRLIETNCYDAIWIGQLCMGIYVEKYYKKLNADCKTKPLLILDQHNEEESFWSSYAASLKNPLFRWISILEKVKNRAQQKLLFPIFDFIVSVSEEDRLNTINYENRAHNVLLGPNGVDIDYFHPVKDDTIKTRPILVFGGSLDVTMNQDAISWFIVNVFPQIVNFVDVELHIVGRNPSKNILRYESENIKIFASVPDVREYYKEADIFIVPLLSGGGTKLKTLEAMAMALPVVTTSIGAQGLKVVSGKHCIIADTPAMFATSVNELLQDAQRANIIGQYARTHVIEHFSWSQIMAAIEYKMNQHAKKNGQ